MSRIIKVYEDFKAGKDFDKYELLEEIKQTLFTITDDFDEYTEMYVQSMEENEYKLYLNDTATNQYADNSYHLYIVLKPDGKKMLSNNIDDLPNHSDDFHTAINRFNDMDVFKNITFYYNNDGKRSYIEMTMRISDGGINNQLKYEDHLVKEGFQIGSTYLALDTGKCVFKCRKPKIYGEFNPGNIKIFGQAHTIYVMDNNWNSVGGFSIDERYANNSIITPNYSNPNGTSNYQKEMDIPEPYLTLMRGFEKHVYPNNPIEAYKAPVKYAQDLFKWFKAND